MESLKGNYRLTFYVSIYNFPYLKMYQELILSFFLFSPFPPFFPLFPLSPFFPSFPRKVVIESAGTVR